MNKLWVCCSFESEYESKLSMSLLSKVSRLTYNHDILLEVVCLTQLDLTVFPVEDMSAFGVSSLHIWRNKYFNEIYIQNYVLSLQKLIKKYQPNYLIFIGTSFYKSTAAQLATSMNMGLTAECSDFYLSENNELIQVRPTFEGNTFAHIRSESSLVMATALPAVNTKTLKEKKQTDVKVNIIDISLPFLDSWIDYQEHESSKIKGKNLSDYSIIFAGGMGLNTKENFRKLQMLAQKYKVGLAATRPVVEMGWADKSCLVGISGHCISPKVYVAFGISGMLQHIEGISGAEIIVSINIDKKAPIHKISNYIIYSDAMEIITNLLQ